MKSVVATLASFGLISACSSRTKTDIEAQDSIVLKCAGWIDGHIFDRGKIEPLGKSNYKTEFRWDGAAKSLTEFQVDGPISYCASDPGEVCSARIESGHLTVETTTYGPGKKPRSFLRTKFYVDVDLSTLNAVRRTSVSSGEILVGSKAENKKFELTHEAELSCKII